MVGGWENEREQDRLTACSPCQRHPPIRQGANLPEVSVRSLDLLDRMLAVEGPAMILRGHWHG